MSFSDQQDIKDLIDCIDEMLHSANWMDEEQHQRIIKLRERFAEK